MLRLIVILLASLLLITVLRSIIGVIMRGFAELLKGDAPKQAASVPPRSEVPSGGELKKDPVCGTFVSAATSMKKTVGGQTVYFCSSDCRDKFTG